MCFFNMYLFSVYYAERNAKMSHLAYVLKETLLSAAITKAWVSSYEKTSFPEMKIPPATLILLHPPSVTPLIDNGLKLSCFPHHSKCCTNLTAHPAAGPARDRCIWWGLAGCSSSQAFVWEEPPSLLRHHVPHSLPLTFLPTLTSARGTCNQREGHL